MRTFVVLCLLATSVTANVLQRKIDSRVVGGNNATDRQFPFAAAIYVTTSDSRYFCGGTLITNRWIITAAQCINRAVLLEIQLGSTSLSNTDSNRLILATEEFVVHPQYIPSTLENDIGLIRTRMEIELSDHVFPIHSLATSDLESSTRVVVVGWGQTSDKDESLSDYLQYVEVSSLSNEECKLTYGNQLSDKMVCVQGNNNEGSCHDDTGGPLVLTTSEGNTQLVGVSSFLSGNGCESTDPSGYTRIYPHLWWIHIMTGIEINRTLSS